MQSNIGELEAFKSKLKDRLETYLLSRNSELDIGDSWETLTPDLLLKVANCLAQLFDNQITTQTIKAEFHTFLKCVKYPIPVNKTALHGVQAQQASLVALLWLLALLSYEQMARSRLKEHGSAFYEETKAMYAVTFSGVFCKHH